MRCPYRPCSTDVEPISMRSDPADASKFEQFVPSHEMPNGRPCLASLMRYPLLPEAAALLDEQAAADEQREREERERKPITSATDKRQGERGGHSKTPRPDPSHPWFRWNGGGQTRTGGTNVPQQGKAGQTVVPLPDEPHAGPGPGRASKPHQPTAADVETRYVRPELRVIGPNDRADAPAPAEPTQGGGSVATVAETRAALAAANQKIAEAMTMAQQASGTLAEAQTQATTAQGLFAEAKSMVDAIRATTVDPLGGPQVSRAAENCEAAASAAAAGIEAADEAFTNGHTAIEQNDIYGGQL